MKKAKTRDKNKSKLNNNSEKHYLGDLLWK